MNKNSHFVAADVLRAVAVLMVVAYHTLTPRYGELLPWAGWFRDFSAPPSPKFFSLYPITFGWAGVSLFFVLSGFCIHLSFLRSTAFSLPHFFWNRVWRIAPAYFVALVAFSLLTHVEFFHLYGWKQFFAHLFFLQDFRGYTFFAINPSFWSIATEMQLYCLFPLLLMVRQRRGIEGCLVVTLAVGLLWRVAAVAKWGLPDHLISPAFCSPLMTWFDWTLGAYVAERAAQSRAAFRYRAVWVVLGLAAFVASTLYKPLTAFSFSLAAVVSAVVLDGLVWTPLRKTALVSALSFVGTVSYSIYLWHQPLVFGTVQSFRLHTTHSVTLVAAMALVAMVFVSYYLFERGGVIAGKVLWRRITGSGVPRARIENEVPTPVS